MKVTALKSDRPCFVTPRTSTENLEELNYRMKCDSSGEPSAMKASPISCKSKDNRFTFHEGATLQDSAVVAVGVIGNTNTVHTNNVATPPRSFSRTSRQDEPYHSLISHNLWNSPDKWDYGQLTSSLIPPPPPAPAKRLRFSYVENFHPSPEIGPSFPEPPCFIEEDEKENDLESMFISPPSSPIRKRPRLTMKTTQQYALDGTPLFHCRETHRALLRSK